MTNSHPINTILDIATVLVFNGASLLYAFFSEHGDGLLKTLVLLTTFGYTIWKWRTEYVKEKLNPKKKK